MTDFALTLASLLTQLSKSVRDLSMEEADSLAGGMGKVAYLAPGTRVMKRSSAVDATVRFLQRLSGSELEQLDSGGGKLAYLAPGAKVIQKSPAADAAMRFFQQLSSDELEQLENGASRIVLLKRGQKVVSPLDIVLVAEEVSRLDTEDGIIRFLDSDSRLTPTALRKVASELGVALPATAKSKPAIQQHIARSLVSYRMGSPRAY